MKVLAKFTHGARSHSIAGEATCVLCEWMESISTESDVNEEVERHLREQHSEVVAFCDIQNAPDSEGHLAFFVLEPSAHQTRKV